MNQKIQSYNDGIANIYNVGNIAELGNLPEQELTLKVGSLCFEERTVGISRFYSALQDNVKIAQMIRTPRLESISPQDIVILSNGKQYEIKQIQYPKGIEPPSMDLSLERLVAEYDVV